MFWLWCSGLQLVYSKLKRIFFLYFQRIQLIVEAINNYDYWTPWFFPIFSRIYRDFLIFYREFLTALVILSPRTGVSVWDKSSFAWRRYVGNKSVLSLVPRLSTWRYPHLLLSACAAYRLSIDICAGARAQQQTSRAPEHTDCCRSMGQTDGHRTVA